MSMPMIPVAAVAGKTLIVDWPSAAGHKAPEEEEEEHLPEPNPELKSTTFAPPIESGLRHKKKKRRPGRLQSRTRVKFSTIAEIFYVSGVKGMSEEEVANVFYTDRDYRKIKRKVNSTIKKAFPLPGKDEDEHDGALPILDESKYCIRGLEHFSSLDVLLERRGWKDTVIGAVLKEQDRQFQMRMSKSWSPGSVGLAVGDMGVEAPSPALVDREATYAIARASSEASLKARALAVEFGAADAAGQALELKRAKEEDQNRKLLRSLLSGISAAPAPTPEPKTAHTHTTSAKISLSSSGGLFNAEDMFLARNWIKRSSDCSSHQASGSGNTAGKVHRRFHSEGWEEGARDTNKFSFLLPKNLLPVTSIRPVRSTAGVTGLKKDDHEHGASAVAIDSPPCEAS